MKFNVVKADIVCPVLASMSAVATLSSIFAPKYLNVLTIVKYT